MSNAADRILRKQGLKETRAWLDAKPERLQTLASLLERWDAPGLRTFLMEAPRNHYGLALQRRAGEGLEWLEAVAKILDHPATTEAYRSIRAGEFWYRALEVSPTLLRSSQPRQQHLEQLRGRIDGMVNLRAESQTSRELCRCLGVDYFHLPVVDHEVPERAQVEEFLRLTEGRRLLVHCFAGRGRTGIFVACYRISGMGMSAIEAVLLTEKEVPGLRPHQRDWVLGFGG